MHILFKYASRSRPEKFFEGLHNIIDMAADKENFTVFCCLDANDQSMFGEGMRMDRVKAGLEALKEGHERLYLDVGQSDSKVHAINRPLPSNIPWDILVNFSDDMRFTVFGYDEIIRDAIKHYGPDVFLHYPDSTAKHILPTMSIMDRTYFERDGYIYHPSYKSLWCDNEAIDVARMRGRYRFIEQQIFDHYHPAYGMVPWDEQYRRQQGLWEEDYQNYLNRQSKRFYEPSITQHIDTNHS